MSSKKPLSAESIQVFRKLLQLALPKKIHFYAAMSLVILQSTLAGFQPYLYQHVIDNFIVKSNLSKLQIWVILLLALLIFQTFLGFINAYLAELIGQNVILRLRNYVFEHLTSLRIGFFDKTPVGTSVTRTISDIETIADLFASGIITIAGDLFQIVLILFLMFWMNWKLALLSLMVVPLLLWAANVFRKGVRDSFQQVRSSITALNAFLQEHITGMQVVQIFNREKQELEKFKKINDTHRKANVKSVFYYAIFFPIVELLVACTFAILITYGSHALLNKQVQIGELTAFILFINLFFRPVRVIADRFNNIQMGMVAVERIFALTEDKAFTEVCGTVKPEQLKGEIEFKNVWFAYEAENWVIRDLSFKIQAGKTVAIVGHTGSGKTTLTQLISGFYPIQKGEILIDGIPLSQYDLRDLRSHISVVLQDVFLFSNTIAENIRLQNESITEEKIMEAAKHLGAWDFMDNLPGKLQYNVMERGLTLSMGQRQLISFIRALVTNPAVLILDEATSSIDSHTEKIIQNAIPKMLANRTSLVIAHRLSTIQQADNILVMDNGKLAESGNHQTLMEKNGLYANLQAQNKEIGN